MQRVIDVLDVGNHVRSWGDAARRLANLDSLVAIAQGYEEEPKQNKLDLYHRTPKDPRRLALDIRLHFVAGSNQCHDPQPRQDQPRLHRIQRLSQYRSTTE